MFHFYASSYFLGSKSSKTIAGFLRMENPAWVKNEDTCWDSWRECDIWRRLKDPKRLKYPPGVRNQDIIGHPLEVNRSIGVADLGRMGSPVEIKNLTCR